MYAEPTGGNGGAKLNFREKIIICAILITLIILIISIITLPITYLLIKESVAKSPNFQVGSLSLTNFTSSVSVTGTWHISFLAQNPHKKIGVVVNYGKLDVLVYYQNAYITGSQILPFKQDSNSEIVLNITIPAFNVKVGQFFLNAMKEEMKAQGSIGFKVKVDGPVTYKPRRFFTKQQRELHIMCEELQVNISSNTSSSGKLIGGPRECEYYS